MLLCYITDRRQFPGPEAEQRRRLLGKIAEAARSGVDYVQLRERDLSGRGLESLAREAVGAVRAAKGKTRLLINSRIDVALAAGADGVHLRSDDISASEARKIVAGRPGFLVGVSCHELEEVRSARAQGADFAIFAPVFEKEGRPGRGLAALREVCAETPGLVLALGGITLENARMCHAAGAAGVAGIRLFQNGDMRTLVEELKRNRG